LRTKLLCKEKVVSKFEKVEIQGFCYLQNSPMVVII